MPLWPGHGQVHDEHVHFGGAHQVDGLAAAGRLAHDPQVHLFGKNCLSPDRTMAWSSTMPTLTMESFMWV